MYPIINIGPFTIGTYGVCCTLGIVLAGFLALFNAKKPKINRYDMILCFAALLIGAGIGAKLLYLIVDFDYICEYFGKYGFSFETITGILQGGFVFYGGFIGGLLGIFILSRIMKVSPIHYIKTIAPSIPLAHAFGRVGCFMAGCCYGIPSEDFGIAFTQSLGAPNGVKYFPVQLLEAALLLVLAAVMQLYYTKAKRRHCVVYVYLFIYPVIRLITERFRYDEERGFYFGLSTSTWISLFIIAAGLVIFFIDMRKGFPEHPTPLTIQELPPEYDDEEEEAEE